MILTFAELGINAAEYNGMHVSQAVPAIINVAADKINLACYGGHPHTGIESVYNWPATLVDFVNHTVELIPESYVNWMLINS